MTILHFNFAIPGSFDWMRDAVCASADPEQWFPEKGVNPFRAKRICQGCPVIDECLQYALDHKVVGIWGGTTTRQRSTMLRLRRAS